MKYFQQVVIVYIFAGNRAYQTMVRFAGIIKIAPVVTFRNIFW